MRNDRGESKVAMVWLGAVEGRDVTTKVVEAAIVAPALNGAVAPDQIGICEPRNRLIMA